MMTLREQFKHMDHAGAAKGWGALGTQAPPLILATKGLLKVHKSPKQIKDAYMSNILKYHGKSLKHIILLQLLLHTKL